MAEINGIGPQNSGKAGVRVTTRKHPAEAQTGDTIQVEIPSGKGLIYLANSYGMPIDDFYKINGIDQNYKPKAGERFYVIKKPDVKTVEEEAKELGSKIYETSEKYRGAVGKPEFDNLIAKINAGNVEDVLKNYTKKESLIRTITRETSSDVQKRKDAVMHVFDALVTARKTPDSIREMFTKELDEQFESFGMVGTKRLEQIMNYMMLSPKELGAEMYRLADNTVAAVGLEKFQLLIDMISPNNVENVLKNYKKNESLIHTITSETGSSASTRKEAVMKVYDALAETKGTPAEKREEFVKELDAQFNKTLGMVDTKKLDEMISEMMKSKSPVQHTTSQQPSSESTVPKNSTKVTLLNGKTMTVSDLQRGAIAAAKNEAKTKFIEFCKDNEIEYDENLLDMTPMSRIPAPVVENGKIVTAESAVLQPTTKPNGKVIIINPGHGGYNKNNGFFDPGSYSFIKKGNGKYAPLLEYEKMKIYGDATVESLRAQGYAVVVMGSHFRTMSADGAVTKLVQGLNNGTKGNKKYDLKDIMFVSLHADSEPGKTGTGICYTPGFDNDEDLRDFLKNSFNEHDWFRGKVSPQVREDLLVLNSTKRVPSVLVEVEYVNGSKCQNLDSSNFQNAFVKQLTKGINDYFGIGQK